MNQAQALFQLQTIDHSISEHKSRLKEIEVALADDQVVRAAEEASDSAEASLAPWRTRVRDLELEIKSITTKSGNVEQRLYSGSVSNPKELQDMQEEIASLKRRKTALEDELLECMIEVESGQEALEQANTTLTEARAAQESTMADMLQEQAERRQTLKELLVSRESAVSNVDQDNLAIYAKLLKNRRGVAVSELDGLICQICGVGQTTTVVQQVRQARQLVFCANCGRILVLPQGE